MPTVSAEVDGIRSVGDFVLVAGKDFGAVDVYAFVEVLVAVFVEEAVAFSHSCIDLWRQHVGGKRAVVFEK